MEPCQIGEKKRVINEADRIGREPKQCPTIIYCSDFRALCRLGQKGWSAAETRPKDGLGEGKGPVGRREEDTGRHEHKGKGWRK